MTKITIGLGVFLLFSLSMVEGMKKNKVDPHKVPVNSVEDFTAFRNDLRAQNRGKRLDSGEGDGGVRSQLNKSPVKSPKSVPSEKNS